MILQDQNQFIGSIQVFHKKGFMLILPSPLFEHKFLLIVDILSKWLEVFSMKSRTMLPTAECLKDCFARFGIPVILVSDNGQQFTLYGCKITESFIKHVHLSSSPALVKQKNMYILWSNIFEQCKSIQIVSVKR